jgi:peroxiredoxin
MVIELTGSPAPEFALADTQGRAVRLSDFRGKKHVVLVFNRGLQ